MATKISTMQNNFSTKTFVVDQSLDGKSIKQYLTENGYSTVQIKRLKYQGDIAVNGQTVTVRYVLKVGDSVQLTTLNALDTPVLAAEPAQIVYEDEWLYVAEKPYGVAIHPDLAHKTNTLGNMLAATFGQGFELRIATRLDKTTSGLVLGAKDAVASSQLNNLIASHQITKVYFALVEGTLPSPSGTIDLPLLRVDSQNKTIVDASGKQAITNYVVLQCFADTNTSLVRAEIVTGRTHQIRAHFSAIGNPIVGDVLYGAKPSERVALHCGLLQFEHPFTHEQIIVESPNSRDFYK